MYRGRCLYDPQQIEKPGGNDGKGREAEGPKRAPAREFSGRTGGRTAERGRRRKRGRASRDTPFLSAARQTEQDEALPKGSRSKYCTCLRLTVAVHEVEHDGRGGGDAGKSEEDQCDAANPGGGREAVLLAALEGERARRGQEER